MVHGVVEREHLLLEIYHLPLWLRLLLSSINHRQFRLFRWFSQADLKSRAQERAEQLKNELNMMRKGTAAEKYRIEASTLKEQLGTATDELIATKASLKKLEMKLKKSKTCNIQ